MYKILFILFFLFPFQYQNNESGKPITIMGLGDSITQGNGNQFTSYTLPLSEMLKANGYHCEFIGPRSFKGIHHCGFGGKNAEFLDSKIDSLYRIYPADIVLLHSGHNHSIEESPVDGIIQAHRSIIQKILAVNPDAIILEAKVIPSGKLPKYSYIPTLNKSIARMVKQMNSNSVVLVDQAKGFDWKKFTIEDKVHPNKTGAEKMAVTWYKVLKKVLAER